MVVARADRDSARHRGGRLARHRRRPRRDDAVAGRASRFPNFWLGPLLAIVFAVELGWLPVSGRGTLAHLVLPAISLGAALAAILARMTRATLLEELREPYVLAARARGVSRTRAVLRHAFRNSLIPVVTIIGLQFGAVLTGAVITETIFAWPGIGRLLIQSIGFRDYPLVQGCILLIAVTYVGVNLLTDLALRRARSADSRSERSMIEVGGVHRRAGRARGARRPVLVVPFDPAAQELALRLEGPSLRAPVRPRRAGARHPRARARRRAHLAARRPRRRRRLVDRRGCCSDRSPATSAGGIDEAISRVDRHPAGVSRAPAGDCARRGARARA